MAKSSTFSLAQWIFLLAVIWGASYFAAVILRDRGGFGQPADPKTPPVGISPEPVKAAAIEWLPPVDEVTPAPERPDRDSFERFRGRAVSEIIAEIRERSPGSGDAVEMEAVRFDEAGTGIENFTRFPDRAAETGLQFTAENVLNGSPGFGLSDLDGDGHRDLQAPAEAGIAGLQLSRNRADGKFEAGAASTGNGAIPSGSRIEAADFDNDGDLDLFVMRSRLPNSLLENSGDGNFRDVTESAGLLEFRWTASAEWVDFDRDGWIDLFVANHPETWGGGEPSCRLFHNRGDGTFDDLGWETGLRFSAYVRDAAWGDLDNDGFPDLAVSTFEMPAPENETDGKKASLPAPILILRSVPADRIGDWRFESVAGGAGMEPVEDAGRIAIQDFDQDGAADLLAGGGVWNGFRLFRNGGHGHFEEISGERGLGEVTGILSMAMADLNGDGHEDLAFGTADQSANRVFLNRGGDSFREVSGAGGFGILQATPALGAGDLDGDGDLELLAAADWTGGAVFENPGVEEHAWLALDLEGVTANRAAVGARVTLVVRDHDWILHRIERTARGPRVELGLGVAASIELLEIEWPVVGWPRSKFTEVPLNRLIRIREGESEFEVIDRKPFRLGGGERGDEKSNES